MIAHCLIALLPRLRPLTLIELRKWGKIGKEPLPISEARVEKETKSWALLTVNGPIEWLTIWVSIICSVFFAINSRDFSCGTQVWSVHTWQLPRTSTRKCSLACLQLVRQFMHWFVWVCLFKCNLIALYHCLARPLFLFLFVLQNKICTKKVNSF